MMSDGSDERGVLCAPHFSWRRVVTETEYRQTMIVLGVLAVFMAMCVGVFTFMVLTTSKG